MQRNTHWWLPGMVLVALSVAACADRASSPTEAGAQAQPKTEQAASNREKAPAADKAPQPANNQPTVAAAPAAAEPPLEEPDGRRRKPQPAEAPYAGLTRLSPDYDVWVDKEQKQVVMVGEVVLRMGPLEMLACPKGTKEHESILAVNTQAQIAHAGLLAVGAMPGAPVQFLPEFRAASGQEIEITLVWKDAQGNERRDRAQSWIRNARTGMPMEHNWVFGGSGFFVNEETGERFYKAEDGDFICISNFPSAMLDLAVESSASNQALLFEANTDVIPEKGTKVTLILKPK